MADGSTILITGSTDGLGLACASDLAAAGGTVLLHGRNEARTGAACERLRAETGNDNVRPYVADLSSLDAVRDLAEQVSSDQERLDVLVNNAGIALSGPDRQLSADGHELTFAVNYLSHFLLTTLLLPLLERSPAARIVNVASIGQAPIDFEDVMLERGYEPMRAYRQSKLAQIMFTFDLAERLDDSATTVNALHPATLMDTKMVRNTFGRVMSSVEEGKEATLRLVTSPELDRVTGCYFDGLRKAEPNRQAYDGAARQRLWELSERLCGL